MTFPSDICHMRDFRECACEEQCAAQPKPAAPIIRPERQDIKTAIAFGILVAGLAFGGAHVLNHYERQAVLEARV